MLKKYCEHCGCKTSSPAVSEDHDDDEDETMEKKSHRHRTASARYEDDDLSSFFQFSTNNVFCPMLLDKSLTTLIGGGGID